MIRAVLIAASIIAGSGTAYAQGLTMFGYGAGGISGGGAPLTNLRITNSGAFRITNTGASRTIAP